MLLLGIETSCDETAAAVVEDGRKIHSSIVSSQLELHRSFGGVVPELASRRHLEQILAVIEEAMTNAGCRWPDLDAIAVTQGPGLAGALLVGVVAAKAIAQSRQLPLVGVHHIAGHVYAAFLGDVEPPLPAACLVVSGGHTHLYRLDPQHRFEALGRTRDDAAGEAFDKVGRMLDLPYPGGPEIDRAAINGNQKRFDFPRAMMDPGNLDFSFSGLKTAVRLSVEELLRQETTLPTEDLAASFQAAVVDVLVEKCMRAIENIDARSLIVVGGVAANRGLRAALEVKCQERGMPLFIPPISLCTDNAAMIAGAGWRRLISHGPDSIDLDVFARFPLEEWA